VRFLGLFYRSSEVANLRKSVGQADVRIRADLENLGTIWVSRNHPGAEWFAVPCELDMEGVSAALWMESVAALRRRHADVSKLREHIVHVAIRDLRETGRHSAAVTGIGPSPMSSNQIRKLEEELVEHFGYAVAGERGRAFEDLEDAEPAPVAGDNHQVPDDVAGQEAEDKQDIGDETQRPVTRRRGRLGTNFLRKE
jgi:hypothetical protein